GNGDGSFSPAPGSPFATGVTDPFSVAIGDLNGDGNLDLAVANEPLGSSSVSVLRGNGNGTFQAAPNFATGTGSFSVAIGDLDGTGGLDLAVANQLSNDVSVLLNGGTNLSTVPHTSIAITVPPDASPVNQLSGPFLTQSDTDLAIAGFS